MVLSWWLRSAITVTAATMTGVSCLRGRCRLVLAESGPGARHNHAADRDPLRHRQRLAEQHDADKRRDRRLKAHPDPEDARRDPTERFKLEPVRDHRGQQPDGEPGPKHRWL